MPPTNIYAVLANGAYYIVSYCDTQGYTCIARELYTFSTRRLQLLYIQVMGSDPWGGSTIDRIIGRGVANSLPLRNKLISEIVEALRLSGQIFVSDTIRHVEGESSEKVVYWSRKRRAPRRIYVRTVGPLFDTRSWITGALAAKQLDNQICTALNALGRRDDLKRVLSSDPLLLREVRRENSVFYGAYNR